MNPWTIRSEQQNTDQNVIQGGERKEWRMGGRLEKGKKDKEGWDGKNIMTVQFLKKNQYSPTEGTGITWGGRLS